MKKFAGVTTALITPFYKGAVDYESLEQLVKSQLKGKVDGFVINGTTAESPTLSATERIKIFELVKKLVPAGFPLIMGTGSNSTEKTIEDSKEAEKLGADAILVVVPYYNKPPQRGLFEHFKAVASSVSIPTILYNVPGRTVTTLEIETIKKLSEHPQIIGIKEASGKIDFAKQIRAQCGESFLLLSGDDATYDQFMAAGGDGAISVASHLIPQVLAKKNASQNLDLIDFLFVEGNPIPLKMALYQMGIIRSPELRLPLVELSPENSVKMKLLLQKKGLLT
jgi:4-hydroxy-tetrahydrodipicolinate synthase